MTKKQIYHTYKSYFNNEKIKGYRGAYIVEMRRQLICELKESERGQKNRYFKNRVLADMFGFTNISNVPHVLKANEARKDIVELVASQKHAWIELGLFPISKFDDEKLITVYKLEKLEA